MSIAHVIKIGSYDPPPVVKTFQSTGELIAFLKLQQEQGNDYAIRIFRNVKLASKMHIEHGVAIGQNVAFGDSSGATGTAIRIGSDVTIADNCRIGANAIIEAGSWLQQDVILKADVTIGKDCKIGKGSIIGSRTIVAEMQTLKPMTVIKDTLSPNWNLVDRNGMTKTLQRDADIVETSEDLWWMKPGALVSDNE